MCHVCVVVRAGILGLLAGIISPSLVETSLGIPSAAEAALPPSSSVEILASSVQFVPETTSRELRSHLRVSGANLIWTDGSEVPVKMMPTTGGPIVPLAMKMGVPAGVLVRGQEVFWIETRAGYSASGCVGSDVIRRLNRSVLTSGTTTTLAVGNNCAGGATDIVVDETSAYWVTSTSSPNTYLIEKVPLAGGASAVLVGTSRRIVSLARDATHLYWGEDDFPDDPPGSTINAIPLSGGIPSVVSSGLRALRGGLVAQGGELFLADTNYSSSHRLMKLPTSGGTPTILLDIPDRYGDQTKSPRKIAADGTNLYWIDATGLNAISVFGGSPTTLANGLDSPVDLTLSSESLIWTETVCCAHGQKGRVKKVSIAGGTVTLLVDAVNAPGPVAVGPSNIYWAEGGPIGEMEGFSRIAQVPIGGGAVTTLVGGVADALPAMAVDSSNVYVADGFTIKRIPLAGGPASVLAVGDFYVYDLATDGVNVYWVEDDPFATVRKVPVLGGNVVTLASGSGPAGPLALDNTYIYRMEHYDTIKRIPKDGGSAVTLASNLPFLSDFVVNGESVYFSEQDTGYIKKMPADGGVASVLAAGLPYSWNLLAVDSVNIYWINQVQVARVSKAGGAPVVLQNNLMSRADIPNGIAVDGIAVYWSEVNGGTIKRWSEGSPGFTLAVEKTGTGAGAVISTVPSGAIDCGTICNGAFVSGTVVTLVATPGPGSTFSGWSGDSDCGDGAVTMTANRSCTAPFTLLTFTLTVTKTGPGSVTADVAGIDCRATCEATYNYNTPVVLTAIPAPGAHFVGWTGAGCIGTEPCTVTMTEARNVTAQFLPPPQFVGAYRDGAWYLDANGNGAWDGCGTDKCLQIGLVGDVALVGDWNGSGTAKVGTFRPSDGAFYLDYNGNGQWDGCGTDRCLSIGLNGDIPLVGDWNGSGTAKVGTFRPTDGAFYLDYNGSGTWEGCGTDRCLYIGLNGDIPLVGDWNGSGTSKVGTFRPTDGAFYLDYNGNGAWEGCSTDRCLQIGMLNDTPLVGDWNGSGTAKVGTFRPSDGTFYLDYNGDGVWNGCGTDRCLQIGMSGDTPLVGKW